MESEPVVYFTNMAQYLNTGMLETNQGSGRVRLKNSEPPDYRSSVTFKLPPSNC